MTMLSIDPGGNIGWALFSPEGEEIGRGKMDFRQFSHSLHYKPQMYNDRLMFTPRGVARLTAALPVDRVTYESFFQDPGVKQGGSTGPAQEVIGVVKYLCLQAGIEPVAQRSAILPIAMKHTGYVQDTKHLRDEDSAWLHGMYRLIGEGVIEPPNSATL